MSYNVKETLYAVQLLGKATSHAFYNVLSSVYWSQKWHDI